MTKHTQRSVNQRIRELEEYYKKNEKDLIYEKAGIPQGTFGSMKIEGKDFRYSTMMKIINCDERINPLWLVMGIGEMFLEGVELLNQEKTKEGGDLGIRLKKVENKIAVNAKTIHSLFNFIKKHIRDVDEIEKEVEAVSEIIKESNKDRS